MQNFILLGIVLLLMWLVMSAPVGVRTVRRTIRVAAARAHVRSALHPFGDHFTWNEAVSAVEVYDAHSGKMITTHTDRSGGFIERDFAIVEQGDGWQTRFTNDTSLAQAFWADHLMEAELVEVSANVTDVTIAETDQYKGIAFLVFRYFALRRQALKLKIWVEQGTFERGGLFEKPSTQIGMALFSALLLWPFFGLNSNGLILSIMLTSVVGLHELGHMIAFRMMGHNSARMIFIPILGGIAMGGRPYDRHFEVGFSALMGAGFSAFVAGACVFMAQFVEGGANNSLLQGILIFSLICTMFNLGNLIPVWKFDGGQVLRQVFREPLALAIAAFVVLGWFAWVGYAMGLSAQTLILVLAVFAILSVMTSKSGIKPKNPLTPMTGHERLGILLAFAAVFSTHASVLMWSAAHLFA